MNSSALHCLPLSRRFALLVSVAMMVLPGLDGMAQSAASFATTPFLKTALETPEKVSTGLSPPVVPMLPKVDAVLPLPPVQPSRVQKPQQVASPAHNGLPIVMFRATGLPQRTNPFAVATLTPQYSEPPVATSNSIGSVPSATVEIAAPVFMRVTQTEPIAVVRTPIEREHRSAFRRIWQDTKTSVLHDVPEAFADALPWVDRNHKDEPFEETLARVADELSRASAQDPEWALPAEEELRKLSKVLQALPEPPPRQALALQSIATRGVEDRPFRPRPIWPGASGRPEQQVRPIAIVTGTELDDGPKVSGVFRPAIPSAEDGDEQAGPRRQGPPPRARASKRARR